MVKWVKWEKNIVLFQKIPLKYFSQTQPNLSWSSIPQTPLFEQFDKQPDISWSPCDRRPNKSVGFDSLNDLIMSFPVLLGLLKIEANTFLVAAKLKTPGSKSNGNLKNFLYKIWL